MVMYVLTQQIHLMEKVIYISRSKKRLLSAMKRAYKLTKNDMEIFSEFDTITTFLPECPEFITLRLEQIETDKMLS